MVCFKNIHKRYYCLFISFFVFSQAYLQEVKDTTFIINDYTCSCQYLKNGLPDIKPFDINEKSPAYPGGLEEVKKFLKKNLNKSMKWNETVKVKFHVDVDGNLSNFQLLNHAAVQKFQELIRVLKISGKWFPGVRENYCVSGDVTIEAEL
ncbi:MAG TPA: hypothetical protein PK275_12575 [Chitinophagaceae bacterium]|nr:hypothetical protein [Chitinophagaceae bacterium]